MVHKETKKNEKRSPPGIWVSGKVGIQCQGTAAGAAAFFYSLMFILV